MTPRQAIECGRRTSSITGFRPSTCGVPDQATTQETFDDMETDSESLKRRRKSMSYLPFLGVEAEERRADRVREVVDLRNRERDGHARQVDVEA